ncbi:HEAT repeat domain-containing protein [Streptomyces sp. NRRL F-2580]|uniref:HEAT repeat domain-containing protein n=1 Tax=Streptomyces sp. NRRL F-2580 TaxID=1463841 RepID=UPI0004C7CD7A|nr:HEAT repeat domain-containing protein [Streptomyces sp. NRRL F-2580]
MAARYPEITSVEEFVRLRLSEDPAECERSAWASMPLSVWWQLVREHPEMRFWAAHNRTCPPEVLAELVKDDDWRVRERVLGRRSCPPELLEQLADDPHDAVRNTVATHSRSPRSAVERLVDDPWPVIAEAARARLANGPAR